MNQTLLYLSQDDVLGTGLSMAEMIPIIEEVFQEHGHGEYENPPKPGIHPGKAFIHAMPGYLPRKKIGGMKWVSSFSENPRLGLPAVMGLFILNDTKTGQPLAVMDCRLMTAMRTGAASAVGAKYLARPDAAVIGIVGAGLQGRYNLLALSHVLPDIREVRVYDIDEQASGKFIRFMGSHCDYPFLAKGSAEDVIKDADVIVTATGRLAAPVFKESWVKEGALVLPVHHRGWENQLLHRADRFVTDDRAQLYQAQREVGGFYGPLPEHCIELGEIVIAKSVGRKNEKERIIDFNYGLAIEDVAVAAMIYKRAKARGIGTVLPLLSGQPREV